MPTSNHLVEIMLCIMIPVCFSVPYALKYLYDHKVIKLSNESATRLNDVLDLDAFHVVVFVVTAICIVVLLVNMVENTHSNFICCHCDRPFTEKLGSVKSVENKYGRTEHYCNRCWNEIKTE